MSLLKKEVDEFREQIRNKMSGFATRSFLPFAMDIVAFVEKVVDKIDELDNRLAKLESSGSTNEKN